MAKKMNTIEKLIAELCPEGVEFKELGDVCEVGDGNHSSNYPKANEFMDRGIPFIRGTNMVNGTISNHDMKYISEAKHFKLQKGHLRVNDVLIMNRGEVGKIAIIPYQFANSNLNSQIAWLRAKKEVLSPKYLFFVLNTSSIQDNIHGEGGALQQLTIKNLKVLKIPIPPLAIQQEIVNILDTYITLEAELETELEAELKARKQQYEYYRDELLTFGDDVEWKTLGEVCLKTENIKWKESKNVEYQYIDLSSVSRENNKISETQTINSTNAPSRAQQILKTNDVIFGTTRPTLKRYGRINSEYNGQICSTGFCVLRANQKIIFPSFMFYILKTMNFYYFVENNQEGAGYPSISNSKVKEFSIPIPPLAEQECIVAILDKFDALVNDISVGLPAELNARRKQYEYYRNKLLTFKPLEEAHAKQ